MQNRNIIHWNQATMKKVSTLNIISVILCIAILASGCASSTLLSTTPTGADVYIQGQRQGTTPYTYSDRKIVGATTMVTFKKEGYEDYNTTIRKTKKLNVGALLSGMLLIYPWFWLLGYDRAHSYDLEEEISVAKPVAVAEPDKPEIEATVTPAVELPDSVTLPTSSRIEKLLSDGQVDNAIEYAEDQEGMFQAGCYYSLAQYFLEKEDYSNAEDFYTRSGKASEGYARIAKALMRGEEKDSTVVLNESDTRAEDLRQTESSGQTTADESAAKVQPAASNNKNIKVVFRGIGLTAEDDRVSITIDSIARTSKRPQDLVRALEASNNSLSSWPKHNNDYVLIYFNRTIKKELNLSSKEQIRGNISLLSDQSLKNYSLILERGHNYVNIPEGGRLWFNPDFPVRNTRDGSVIYGVIINYNYMMFYMPVTSTPVQLKYQYNYKNDENDKKPTTGSLTINLK